ncbi:hypothetical protein C8Q79DRAFT_899381 [Trametes meyenii]|nr:hypothetical protein C8Q79DRAFT_899381 [Trametes meyenii]
MLWRVGRDFRHLYQAAQTLLERSRVPPHPLCLIAKPIHSSRASWRPAVALKLNHSYAATVDELPDGLGPAHEGDERVESALLRWKRPNMDDNGTTQEEPPPAHIIALLEDVLPPHSGRLPRLQDIRRLSAGPELLKHMRLPGRAPALVHHFLDSKNAWRALWVVEIANDNGYNFSPRFFGDTAGKLAQSKEWRLILRLTCIAREQLGYTTTALLNWRLQALMESQYYIGLQGALALFTKEHVRPSRLTYHLLISMRLRNHDLAGALASVRIMESDGFRVSARTWAVILFNYRSLGLTPSAKKQALAAMQTADAHTATVILNSLVQLLLDAHDMAGVVEILSLVSHPTGDPSADPGVGTIQEGGASTDGSQGTLAQSNQSLHRIHIDISTYNILLKYLARRGDLTRSLQILDQMRVAKILPNADTAAALTHLYFTIDCPNDALHIVSDALRNSRIAAALLPSLGYSDSIPARHPTYPLTASPTIGLFNALVTGILQTRGLGGLHTVLRMMRLVEVSADSTTLAILMSHLHQRERPRLRELIRAVRALMSAGMAPTQRHLHILMAALLREERTLAHPRGWAVGSSSQEAPPLPTADASRAIMDDYTHPTAGIVFPRRLKYHRLFRPIMRSLTARGVRSDRVAFAMRIKHDGVVKRDLEQALTSFRAMVDAGIRPNEFHYGALMEGYTVAGNMAGAADLMREAADAGVRVDVKTHTILIAGHARLAEPTSAVQAFRGMVAAGLRPDVPAIDALVSAFFRAKAYRMARRVLLQLWPQVGPMPEGLTGAPLRELAVTFRKLHGTNASVPARLSSTEQRMLRWKIRDILRRWKAALGYSPRREEVHRRVRPVPLTRIPEYTRAKRR